MANFAHFQRERDSSSTAESQLPAPRCWRVAAYLGYIVLLLLTFLRPIFEWISHATTADIHSHTLLIPFISGYLIYAQRRELPRQYTTSFGPALVSLLCGLIALVGAWNLRSSQTVISQSDYLSLVSLGLICLLVTGGFLFLGSQWMAAVVFPLAFLIFAIPLPDQVLNFLETASQAASTEAAAMFFTLAGTPMLRLGAVFQLPGIAIEVAQECSGIRSSWVLLITTLAASYLFLKSPWRRALLIAFVIPLAILRNGFRIWVIGLLCVEVGPHMIHSPLHHRGGPLFFALSLIPLFLLLWWLRRGETAKENSSGSEFGSRRLTQT